MIQKKEQPGIMKNKIIALLLLALMVIGVGFYTWKQLSTTEEIRKEKTEEKKTSIPFGIYS